ncbi:hypothetical protein DFH09DRAFT_816898, partial [Mycena vulgaris]
PMSVLIPATAVVGAVTFAWSLCRTVASLSIISIIYRFSLGAFSAIAYAAIAAMGETEDLGRRIGTMNTVLGIGVLCGPPLAELLNKTHLGYKAVGYFGGMSV